MVRHRERRAKRGSEVVMTWGKDDLDTKFTPCPFCGKGELIVSGADGGLMHALPTCETYDRIDSLPALTDALALVRLLGFPHGKPEISGPLPERLDRKDWS